MKNVKEKIKNILRYGILSIIIPLISGLLYDINHFLIMLVIQVILILISYGLYIVLKWSGLE
jgi:hypothetical protein